MNVVQIKNVKIGEGIPKLIVPLMGETEEQLMVEVVEVIKLSPDIVEWRADVFDQVENPEAVQKMISKMQQSLAGIPLLFTFRTHKEGGKKEVTDQYYFQLLEKTIKTKMVDIIDIELFVGEQEVRSLVRKAKENNLYVIVSNHDFEKTPAKEEIIARLRAMQDLGADIPKIAVMPHSVDDVLTLLDATNAMKSHYANSPLITMAMGEKGLISRLAGEVFGSAATFGMGKGASAPGQIMVDDLRHVLDVIHGNK
ncbi:type I 3-dehydroquinate dehydratase [Virgibacillus ainsalahensis]